MFTDDSAPQDQGRLPSTMPPADAAPEDRSGQAEPGAPGDPRDEGAPDSDEIYVPV